jgi:hypothetical protein
MNPKCHSRPVCDTFSVRKADSTGLFSMPITRAVSLPEASRASERKDSTPRCGSGRLRPSYGRAERDDCGHAANNFPQEVTGQLTSALVPFLTARDISRQIFGYEDWMRISNRKVPPTHGGKAYAHLEGSRRCLGRTAPQPAPSCMRSHDLRRCKLLCKKGSFFRRWGYDLVVAPSS